MCDLYIYDTNTKWYLVDDHGSPGYSTDYINPLSYSNDDKKIRYDANTTLDCLSGKCVLGPGAGQIFNAIEIGIGANQYLFQADGNNNMCLGNSGGTASLISCTDFSNARHA